MNQTTLASQASLDKTVAALQLHNYDAMVVETKADALKKIKELIPTGASVMNGASKTLEQVGFIEYLKEGKHGWKNLHAEILSETDKVKQGALRKQSVISDYYLGSVHAVTETGEMVIASNSGSQLPHLAFTSQNIILVIGVQKITPTLTDALKRVEDIVIPLEDERMKGVYGFGTMYAKTLILRKENPSIGRSIKVIIVNEALGF